MIRHYNTSAPAASQIEVGSKNKAQLWHAIDEKMRAYCKDEHCWLTKLGLIEQQDESFLPEGPPGQYDWLSTNQIRAALKVYEKIHPEFVALGPVPIDFCRLTGNEVCNINLKSLLRTGKTKIGVVFNTDPSSESGKHWVSMFIDISAKDPKKWEINYFDSFGQAPLAPEIQNLIANLQEQNGGNFLVGLNCKIVPNGICTVSARHQYKSTECGVYSINFIVERLKGKSWKRKIDEALDDETINRLRQSYFRPASSDK